MKNTKIMKATALLFKLVKGYDTGEEAPVETAVDAVDDAWLDEIFGDSSEAPKTEGDQPVEVSDEVVEEVKEPAAKEAPVVETGVKPVVEQPVVEQKPTVVEKPVVNEPSEEDVKKQQEAFQSQVEAYRGELQKQYAISDEDADAILTDPKVVLPKLMANMHLAMLQQVGQLMQQITPGLVQQQVKTVGVTEQRLKVFSEKYPDLVAPENQEIAVQAVRLVKQLHPNASFEELVEKAGPVAYSLLGKAVPTATQVAAPTQTAAKPKPHIPAKQTTSAEAKKPLPSDPTEAFLATLTRY